MIIQHKLLMSNTD